MAELLKDDTDKALVEEATNIDSDADSLDSDGYDRLDPYAAQAKQIDRRNKVVMDFHDRPLIVASNTIIKNRENITNFEKKYMKYVVLVGLLGYLIFSNVSNMEESSNLRSRKQA